jgi:hypothetical protein
MAHNVITVLPLAGRACVALRATGTSSKEMRVIGGDDAAVNDRLCQPFQ